MTMETSRMQTIALVDDDRNILTSVSIALEAEGYTVKRNPMSFAFAALHGIRIADDGLEGGADPQRDGMALQV